MNNGVYGPTLTRVVGVADAIARRGLGHTARFLGMVESKLAVNGILVYHGNLSMPCMRIASAEKPLL